MIIKNKRATFEFEILDKYVAGIMLRGTEIKSIRNGKANISESYCLYIKDELWIKGMNISEYEMGTAWNHEPLRMRKLLLTGREMKKLHAKVKERGYTIVPLSLFISERGIAKIEIALARGKKTHDKRESIKERETKLEMKRHIKLR